MTLSLLGLYTLTKYSYQLYYLTINQDRAVNQELAKLFGLYTFKQNSQAFFPQ
jgi:hypothetical protein